MIRDFLRLVCVVALMLAGLLALFAMRLAVGP